ASTTWLRLFRAFIHRPMIVSDSPPSSPGTHIEYVSAVSMKLPPAARKASSSSKEPASSTVQPKTLPPKHSVETSKLELPKLVVFIVKFSRFYLNWKLDARLTTEQQCDRVLRRPVQFARLRARRPKRRR